jgi:hypothetical protein
VDDSTGTGARPAFLVGNVSKLFGGIEVFADADDGLLELGIVTADGLVGGRGRSRGPPVRRASRRSCSTKALGGIELDKVLYGLDGGDPPRRVAADL